MFLVSEFFLRINRSTHEQWISGNDSNRDKCFLSFLFYLRYHLLKLLPNTLTQIDCGKEREKNLQRAQRKFVIIVLITWRRSFATLLFEISTIVRTLASVSHNPLRSRNSSACTSRGNLRSGRRRSPTVEIIFFRRRSPTYFSSRRNSRSTSRTRSFFAL